MMKKVILAIIAFIIITVVSVILIMSNKGQQQEKIGMQPIRTAPTGDKKLEKSITIGAVGDILIHDRVYNDAQTSKKTYNFKPMLEKIKPELLKPDILLANQETIVAGTNIGLSGYPAFNSPHEIADALKEAGVDIVTTANNHALDRGPDGQMKSLAYLKKIKMPYVGTFTSAKDQQTIRIMEKNGIKVAFLSYTYGTNGIPIPNKQPYIVNIIDKNNMKKELARAKKQADIIVMGIHWGNEYERFPNTEQKELAQFLVNEGANIIFGGHPHVLQHMEWLTNKQGKKALVVYSLGNFLSGQDEDYRNIGGLASVTIKKTIKNNQAEIQLENPSFFPTYNYSNKEKDYELRPLKEANDKNLKHSYKEIMDHMMQELH
ncbi:CapA family protein [Niallia nealsonii]|uniref:Capsular biosynthesis protein n=1 Tax=Niallia nealsonii TaxID=115979 RepID=A0A2N0YYS5_9BACI|nr:CapA family protein [Niallia nealsonii]PKG22411.1 capsular biosynthesis protein [Niallia nealsonii]